MNPGYTDWASGWLWAYNELKDGAGVETVFEQTEEYASRLWRDGAYEAIADWGQEQAMREAMR